MLYFPSLWIWQITFLFSGELRGGSPHGKVRDSSLLLGTGEETVPLCPGGSAAPPRTGLCLRSVRPNPSELRALLLFCLPESAPAGRTDVDSATLPGFSVCGIWAAVSSRNDEDSLVAELL